MATLKAVWTWLTKLTTIVQLIGVWLLLSGSVMLGCLFFLIGGATAYIVHKLHQDSLALAAAFDKAQHPEKSDPVRALGTERISRVSLS